MLRSDFSRMIAGRPCAALVTVFLCAFFCTGVYGQNGNSTISEDYLIGPGDVLNIDVWREPNLSVILPVRPDGRISTPLVEDMVAVGKSPSTLARDIEAVLLENYRSPRVTVIVQSFVGTFQSQVRVIGEVAIPDSYPYRQGMTLFDVLLEAGGLTEFAANNGRLTRMVDGEQQEHRLRLKKLMKKGNLEENMPLVPGDVIVVPSKVF